MINAVRISKTSAKQWELHGPIQEAHQVKGVAVITGPGGSDVPGMERMSCVLMALAGQHDEKTE
jgi:hypothetical protein